MSSLNNCGIYFLFLKGKLQYIGKSEDMFARVKTHRYQGLQFDDIKTKAFRPDQLDFCEKYFIERLKPRLNKALKPKSSKKKKKNKYLPGIFWPMRFRKLTRKSFIDFGTYSSRTVDNMLKHGKHIDLASMYFNLSHITFFDDVLVEIGISQEWRIEKPGKDKNKYYEWAHSLYPKEMEQRKSNANAHDRRVSKMILRNQAINMNHKSVGQAIQQKKGINKK